MLDPKGMAAALAVFNKTYMTKDGPIKAALTEYLGALDTQPVSFQWKTVDGWQESNTAGSNEDRQRYALGMSGIIGLGYRELYAGPNKAAAKPKVKPLIWGTFFALNRSTKLLGMDHFGNEFARLDGIETISSDIIERFKKKKQAEYEKLVLSALEEGEGEPSTKSEERHTFSVPDGFEVDLDAEGRATGIVSAHHSVIQAFETQISLMSIALNKIAETSETYNGLRMLVYKPTLSAEVMQSLAFQTLEKIDKIRIDPQPKAGPITQPKSDKPLVGIDRVAAYAQSMIDCTMPDEAVGAGYRLAMQDVVAFCKRSKEGEAQ